MRAFRGILIVLLFLLPAGAAAAEAPPRTPDQLWREFPLEPVVTAPGRPAPATRPATPPATVPAAPASVPEPAPVAESDAQRWPLVLLGIAGALVIVVLAGTVVVRSRRPRGTQAPQSLQQPTATREELVARGAPAAGSYGEIGDSVTEVLGAAQAAAEKLRADAQREAAEILRVAEQETATVHERAADVRAEAEAFAAKLRREAEQQARLHLAEAENRARATRDAAEKMAVQVEEAARGRELALEEASRSADDRLRKMLQELQRVSAQLDALADDSAPRAGSDSLVEALMPRATSGGEGGER